MSNVTVNPWQKFRSLLPDGGRTYGTIVSVNVPLNSSTVQLANGDQVAVKGSDYQVGDRVLIADGEIRQQVPSLPSSTIELY